MGKSIKSIIKESVDLKTIYDYMKKLSFPYHYEVEYDLWEKSYLHDVDGEGRTLFHNLTTMGAYNDGKLIGFIQYGRTAFGFNEKGEISDAISCSVIRNFYYEEDCEKAGRKLLNEAVNRLADKSGKIYAFFHYFGMSCYARHGKLFEGFEHVQNLLMQTGFYIEHENVFYSSRLNCEALEEVSVKCEWNNITVGNQQFCDFRLEKDVVGGCEIHLLEQKNIAYLRWIFTNEEIRGKGIGSYCMAALKSELLKKGVLQLDTDTALDNQVAQHFYEKNNFVREGLTRSYIKEVKKVNESQKNDNRRL
jgi:GNAT superfamily N-acetyltransferase